MFPDQASTFAWQVDALYFYLIFISLAFMIPILGVIFFFGIRYNEKEKYAAPEGLHGSILLETTWSVIPFIISMSIFLGGAYVFFTQYRMPEDAMGVYVVGKQWMWKMQHETGHSEINELHVPVNRKVKLTMTTEDALHSVFIPAFRTKMDVVPGRYTYLWFEATVPGEYHLFCAEFCGLNHAGMIGKVIVMEERDFDNWLSGSVSGQTPVEAGRDLFTNKLGCASCHTGGADQRGAKLEGIFGQEVKLVGGRTVIADEAYIRDSILNPGTNVVEGYQPIMPTFKGQVTEEQLVSLVAYIKSLSGDAPGTTPSAAPPAPGATAAPAANTNTTADSN